MNKRKSTSKLIVAGGGTGGHVLAGVAIADEWRDRIGGVLFVGARGGIEEKLVPRAGYELELLLLGSLKGVGFAKRVTTLLKLPYSFLRSAVILLRERPRAVIGVGGYASGPLVLMARLLGWLWGVKVAILEQNAVPGFTNRILGRMAHDVFAAFPGIEGVFRSKKVVVTGNPIRSSIRPMASASRSKFTIFIFGGSQGAAGINTLVLDALDHLEELKSELHFIHQTGERDFDRVNQGHKKAGFDARVEKFIYEMSECYAKASLVICRAGSSTLSELAAAGRAAVLVPFPYASDNHQEKNARIYAEAGAAKILLQFKSQGKDLADIIRAMYKNNVAIDEMEKAVKCFYRPNAAKDIVERLLIG